MKEEKQSKVLKKGSVWYTLPFSADSVPLIWQPNEWDGRTLFIVR